MKLLFLSCIVVMLSNQVFAGECNFENEINDYQIKDAVEDAKAVLTSANNIKFYAVTGGFASSRPGFERSERACVVKKYQWHKLWAGSDMIGSCRDRKRTQAHALAYAEAFNSALKNGLIKSGQYKCD